MNSHTTVVCGGGGGYGSSGYGAGGSRYNTSQQDAKSGVCVITYWEPIWINAN